MKKALIVLVGLAVGTVGFAQDGQSWTDRAIATSITVAKNLWGKLEKEGRPLAERLLKSAPDYYKSSQKTLADMVAKVNKADLPKTFREKQEFALQVWKLRGAIDVVSLSDPNVVKSLINLRPEDVSKMQKDLRDSEAKLKKANFPGI